MIITNYGSNYDPDTYLESGCGYCEIQADKSPTGAYRGWYMYCIKVSSSCTIQYITPDNYVNTDMYMRKKSGDNWTDWARVDNFGCNTPEALASLLGGTLKAYGAAATGDANLIKAAGVYNYTSDNCTNVPSVYGNGAFIVIETGTWVIQVILMSDRVYFRRANSSKSFDNIAWREIPNSAI